MKPNVGLKLDADGRVLVLVAGGMAWVIDKLGAKHRLHPVSQLAHPVDMTKDTRFNVGWHHAEDEKGH